ncbi:CGNR zinc finger domain-containing protein [Tepidibacter aestuarii]|uniref:CGNR zinc finger domain-containing protein n=1 Tax=Tepidibacter aestuarii TaxID=2925782 RepID=UPI0020BF3978|nr:CGNR zinc finger domain-containing protein [Tepidibacter aestuarii]CAH2214867.1 zf-CGNR domain-containing protein [Tepidibacter aestuarii]
MANEKFPNVSDRLTLNFVNTKISRNGKIIELLNSVEDFQNWIEQIILTGPKYSQQLEFIKEIYTNQEEFARLIEFRDYLYKELIYSIDSGSMSTSLTAFIEGISQYNPFIYKKIGSTFLILPKYIEREPIKNIILLDLIDMISENEFCKLKRCYNPQCVLLFVDKTGRRKWCSMKICGNRKKVERFSKK